MDGIRELLALPLETLVVIAAGYLSYRVAYTGKDSYHGSVDVLFCSVVFGAIAQSALLGWTSWMHRGGAIQHYDMQIYMRISAILFAILAALVSACVWRRSGAELVRNLLRYLGISYADRNRSAWETIIGRESVSPQSLLLKLTNGDEVMCEQLSDFEDEKLGPCILGNDGSVALFVTSSRNKDDEGWTEFDPRHDGWGPLMTTYPCSQIANISIRHGPRKTRETIWRRLTLWWRRS